jgi:hypothetical protein
MCEGDRVRFAVLPLHKRLLRPVLSYHQGAAFAVLLSQLRGAHAEHTPPNARERCSGGFILVSPSCFAPCGYVGVLSPRRSHVSII